MSRALVVFAKTPVAGAVKTRLAGVLGPEGAKRLYTAFLRDTAHRLGTLNKSGSPAIRIRWHVTPDPEPLREFTGEADLLGQTGSSLGERMRAAFDAATDDGYESVVIIGTDTPTLGVETILRAFDLMSAEGQAVLGPAADGGYYLLGLRKVDPGFLESVSYSRPDVLSKTESLLTSAGYSVKYLPELFDVDRPEDLEQLQALLDEDPSVAPRTARFLQQWNASERLR